MKRIILVIILLVPMYVCAQDFDSYFTDKTLRLDLNFSGMVESHDVVRNNISIALDELCSFDGWYGKRKRLAEVPMKGNGEVVVRTKRFQKAPEGEVIYRNSFSTLFQEWLTYDEAKKMCRSFENVFLIPMPKDTVDITINLYDNRQEMMATATFTVNPKDILIHQLKQDVPFLVLQKGMSPAIDIAFVAEGYQEQEMDTFLKDAQVAVDALFEHEPFKSRRESFNIIAVKSASVDSGTSEPKNGIWKRTVLSSHFDTFYSDRYLTTLHLKDLHNVLAGIPYEHIIVLVNTSKYGGGGILNSYNLSMTHHKFYKQVVVHEFGHSFAGLADEYAYESEQIPMYPHDVEPWEKNITTKVDFRNKWEDLVGSKRSPEVGFYEGAGYSLKGVWRACENCRMRVNDYPDFCPACQKAIGDVIDFYVK